MKPKLDLKRLPGKRDKKWLIAIVPLAIGIGAVLAGFSAVMLDMQPAAADAAIWMTMALIASIAVCGFCYAGLKIAAAACVMGVIVGIGHMAYVFAQPVDWRGIAGLVSGAQAAFLFFLAGINLEMVCHVRKKRGGNPYNE